MRERVEMRLSPELVVALNRQAEAARTTRTAVVEGLLLDALGMDGGIASGWKAGIAEVVDRLDDHERRLGVIEELAREGR